MKASFISKINNLRLQKYREVNMTTDVEHKDVSGT